MRRPRAGAGVDLLLHAHQADAQLVELSAEQDQVVQRPPQPVVGQFEFS